MATTTRRMPDVGRTGLVAALLLVALTACSGSASRSDDGDGSSKSGPYSVPESAADHVGGDGTVKVRLTQDWSVPLLPYLLPADRNAPVMNAAYDKLLFFDENTQLQPYLAESWEATPEEVTFTLRSDVTCADGTPMTAEVVQKSLDMALNTRGDAARHLLRPRAVRGGGRQRGRHGDRTAGQAEQRLGGSFCRHHLGHRVLGWLRRGRRPDAEHVRNGTLRRDRGGPGGVADLHPQRRVGLGPQRRDGRGQAQDAWCWK